MERMFTVDAHARVAIITWPDGQPELGEWRACFERLLSHPDFQPSFGIVSDRRALTASPNSPFVHGFVDTVTDYAGAGRFVGRWATVVAPAQLAVYGMGRMTEILSESEVLPYRVFTDFERAVAWASRRQDP